MRKSSFFVCLALLVSSSVVADPISGLNLEDFQTGAKKKIEWNSNPFVKHGDTPQSGQMKLYGIVYGPHKSLALINREIVSVGDRIGTSKIVSIDRKKVVLTNDDGIYQITMRGDASNDKT